MRSTCNALHGLEDQIVFLVLALRPALPDRQPNLTDIKFHLVLAKLRLQSPTDYFKGKAIVRDSEDCTADTSS